VCALLRRGVDRRDLADPGERLGAPGHRHGHPVYLPQHQPAVFQPVGDLRGNVPDRGAAQPGQERMVPGVEQVTVGDGGQPGLAGRRRVRGHQFTQPVQALAAVHGHRGAGPALPPPREPLGRAYLGADARKRWYQHVDELVGRLARHGGHRERESRRAG
jgi:hypothetical protein